MTETPKAEEAVSDEKLAGLIETFEHYQTLVYADAHDADVLRALRELQRRRAAPASGGYNASAEQMLECAFAEMTEGEQYDGDKYAQFMNVMRKHVYPLFDSTQASAPAGSVESEAVQRYKIDSEGTYVSDTGRILLEEAVKASDFDREVAALQAERERLKAERDQWMTRAGAALLLVPGDKLCGELRAGAERLQAELQAAQADARRYRWLRQRLRFANYMSRAELVLPLRADLMPAATEAHAESIDAAIYSLMQSAPSEVKP